MQSVHAESILTGLLNLKKPRFFSGLSKFLKLCQFKKWLKSCPQVFTSKRF
jgi:hypothetical protein